MPCVAAQLAVEPRADKASDRGCEGVDDHQGGDDGASAGDVNDAGNGRHNDDEGGGEEVRAGAHEGGEEVQAGGEPEDVGVEQLPGNFVLDGLTALHFARNGKVVVHDAQEDDGETRGEEDDEDEAVDDREPVHLQRGGQLVALVKGGHAIFPGGVHGVPLGAVAEGDGHARWVVRLQQLSAGGVGGEVHADDVAVVVGDGEMEVLVQVRVPGLPADVREDGVGLVRVAHEAPERQAV